MQIPGYIVGDLLHRSAQSEVHRAVRTRDDRRVIVKSVSVQDEASVMRCRNQFDLSSTLSLTGVVRALDLVQTTSHLHLVMEDAGPADLRQVIARDAMSLEDILVYGERLASALESLHGHHILHRDLNPANIVVDPSDRSVRIADLGLAVRVPAAAPYHYTERLEGTLAYMAPEQTGRVRRPIDTRSDLYALGCVLYDMACRTPPFESDDALELIHAQIARTPVPVADRRTDLPASLATLIDTLLQKDPDRRYETAYGVMHDLAAIRRGLDTNTVVQLRTHDRSDRFKISTKVFGRARELDMMRAARQKSLDGRLTAVILRGTAGSGKSALLRTFEREARETGTVIIGGKFEQYGNPMPLFGITQALSTFVRGILREPDHVVQAWRERLREALGTNASLVRQNVPDLSVLIGEHDEQATSTIRAQEVQARLYIGISSMLRCISEHVQALVLSLDDIQWADTATFEFLAIMDNEIGDHPVTVVCTMRSEEVLADDHPLQTWINNVAERPLDLTVMDIYALGSDTITDLVQETFGISPSISAPLVQALQRRAGGNPLFSWQLLAYMVNEGIIHFDRRAREWTWDDVRLHVLPSQFDVQELIASRVGQLDEEPRMMLAIAACIGTSFHVDRLAKVAGIAREAAVAAIDHCMAAGLVTWGDATMTGVFEFVHDRIQQAAHSALPSAEQQRVHAAISRTYMDAHGHVPAEDLLEAAGHVERCIETFVSDIERRRAALIMYAAGHRARAQGALHVARRHLETGRTLEDAHLWASHHDVLFRARLELVDCLGAAGEYQAADALMPDVLERAATTIERADALYQHLKILTVQARFTEVLDIGIEALGLLGITVPKRPTKVDVVRRLLRALVVSRRVDTRRMLDRPFTHDPRVSLASQLLYGLTSPGYNFSVDLLTTIVLERTLLVLQHGHSDVSIDAYGMFGLVLCGLGRMQRGADFAQLSIDLVARSSDPGAQHRAHNTAAGNVLLWTRPIEECIEQFRLGGDVSVAAGEQHGTLWAFGVRSEQMLFAGRPVAELAAVLEDSVQILHSVYMRASGLPWTSIYFEAAVHRVLLAVAPETMPIPDLVELIEDDRSLKEHMVESNGAASMSSWLSSELQIAVLLWRTDAAIAVYAAFEAWKHGASGQVTDAERVFFGGLADAQRRLHASGRRTRTGPSLERCIRKYRTWAEASPRNFAHRLYILRGAKAIIDGKIDDAHREFADAVAAARAAHDLRLEALALEWMAIAAERSQYRDAAVAARQRAAAAWRAWGATALAERLDTHEGSAPIPTRLDRATITQTVDVDSLGMSQASIDIDTVLKASSAISSTIVFDDLVRDMLRIVIENAGADRAVLLLMDDGVPHITAVTSVQATPELGLHIPLHDATDVCRPVVLQALRTGSTTIVDDTQADEGLQTDPYIIAHGPRSIMVLPIAHQAKQVGLLYLENSSTTHVFTPDRSRVLQLLSSQIAISIENARLYAEQERLHAASARFVPTEFLASLGRKSIRDVRLGDAVRTSMTVMFADIRGFTSIAEGAPAEQVFHLLNQYLAGIVPVIRDHHGFIDKFIGDAIMGLFPRDPIDAVRAAQDISKALHAVNEQLRQEGHPTLSVGIGIHTGELVLGTVGSDRRMDTTAIGDTVNVAARIEELTKQHSVEIMISDDVLSAIDVSGLVIRHVGDTSIRGRSRSIGLHEVLP